ncbi:hypothetical protein BGX38DRAFT_1195249 [Terfezia claveryi]|nr:hypothetical protein BGX38DRAFT_1195249 [Terfezia claveryi]
MILHRAFITNPFLTPSKSHSHFLPPFRFFFPFTDPYNIATTSLSASKSSSAAIISALATAGGGGCSCDSGNGAVNDAGSDDDSVACVFRRGREEYMDIGVCGREDAGEEITVRGLGVTLIERRPGGGDGSDCACRSSSCSPKKLSRSAPSPSVRVTCSRFNVCMV